MGRRSSSGDDDRSEARTQGAPIAAAIGATEDAGSGRAASPDGTADAPSGSPYNPIARLYDPWSASVTEDVEFYVEEARASGGPVVELACGTGRISVPVAKAGVPVIGVDASAGMLEVAGSTPPRRASSSTFGSATCASRRSRSASRSC